MTLKTLTHPTELNLDTFDWSHPVIDSHAHLWLGNEEAGRRANLEAAELYNVRYIYISTLGGGYYPDKDDVAACNRATADFINDYPDLIVGQCYVNPNNADTLDVLRRGFEEQGMRAVKLWTATFADDPAVNPIAEYCIDRNIPVMIHCFHKAVGQLEHETRGHHVANLARRYPELKIQMAHLGACPYEAIPPIADLPNVWLDTSGSMMRGDDLPYTLSLVNHERIMMGTDMPGSGYLTNIGKVLEATADPVARRAMLHDNAYKLYFPEAN